MTSILAEPSDFEQAVFAHIRANSNRPVTISHRNSMHHTGMAIFAYLNSKDIQTATIYLINNQIVIDLFEYGEYMRSEYIELADNDCFHRLDRILKTKSAFYSLLEYVNRIFK